TDAIERDDGKLRDIDKHRRFRAGAVQILVMNAEIETIRHAGLPLAQSRPLLRDHIRRCRLAFLLQRLTESNERHSEARSERASPSTCRHRGRKSLLTRLNN